MLLSWILHYCLFSQHTSPWIYLIGRQSSFVSKCSCRWIDTGFFLQTGNLFLLLHSIIHLSKDSSLHSIPDPKSFSLQKNILQIESLLFQILEATAVPMWILLWVQLSVNFSKWPSPTEPDWCHCHDGQRLLCCASSSAEVCKKGSQYYFNGFDIISQGC